MTIDPARWYPVAASDDLPYGHVYQTMLGGQGLAIWRASAGQVNIWEDRCPHRGVRFSIGSVRDDELRCQYHAWRFASGSGACTFIPARPDARPAAAIRARAWPAAERGGLVWTGLAPEGVPPAPAEGAVLRAVPVNRDAAAVAEALSGLTGGDSYVQPVTARRSVIRGIAPPEMLRTLDAALERLRRELEIEPC